MESEQTNGHSLNPSEIQPSQMLNSDDLLMHTDFKFEVIQIRTNFRQNNQSNRTMCDELAL